MSFRSKLFIFSTVAGFAISQSVLAQPPPQGPQSPSQATPLPLSGRSGQSGSATVVETPAPGLTSSVNTLNTTIQIQGPYQGSVRSGAQALSGRLSLRDAITRGLEHNLGTVGLTQAIRQAHGQARVARGSLLPNLSAALREDVQQTDLQALGIRFNAPIPGFFGADRGWSVQLLRPPFHSYPKGLRHDGIEQLSIGQGIGTSKHRRYARCA